MRQNTNCDTNPIYFFMDFEEQLESFFIKKDESTSSADVKKVLNNKNIFLSKDVFKYIPLLLKHMHSVNVDTGTDKTSTINLFSNTIKFKHCLVYGRIISRGRDSKETYNYVLDDGTATMDVSLYQREADTNDIWKLENELQALKMDMLAQNKNEIIGSLQNLLFTTKEHIDFSNIQMGTKVLLYGKPARFKKEASLNVFSLMKDTEINRDLEIAFKDYLIDWYKNNVSISHF